MAEKETMADFEAEINASLKRYSFKVFFIN